MRTTIMKSCTVVATLLSTVAFVHAQIGFKPAVRYEVGLNPSGLTTADFDNDGYMDVAVITNDSPPRLTFLMNTKEGNLGDGGSLLLPKGARGARVVAADMNHNGQADLVLLLPELQEVWVLINGGCAGWIRTAVEPTGVDPHSMAIGDIDGNGALDVVVANTGSNTVTVMMNFGEPQFELRTLKVGAAPKHVALGDLTLEKNMGLGMAVSNSGDQTISVYQYNPAWGKFTLTDGMNTGSTIVDGLTMGDWNRDGMADIAAALRGRGADSSSVMVWLNQYGRFNRSTKYMTYALGAIGITNADLNGDGIPDLVTADAGSDSLTVLTGIRGGRFSINTKPLMVGVGPDEVYVADMDGDGDMDILSLDSGSTGISVLLNTLYDKN